MSTSQSHERYANFFSRFILSPIFRDQWIIPQAPRTLASFLGWYEKNHMSIDVGAIQIDRPIFLISMPRCGSSMLQNIISEHPSAAFITNTMHQFRNCFCAAERFRRNFGLDVEGERFLGDSVTVTAGNPSDPVGTWAEWVDYDPWTLEYKELRSRSLPTPIKERIINDIKKIIWCFDPEGKRRFLCKTPALLPQLLLLNDLFPDAKFIHLVRDARPSANSLVKLYKKTNAQLNLIRKRKPAVSTRTGDFVPYPRLPNLQSYIESFGADDIRTTAHLWSDGLNFFEERKNNLQSYIEVRYEDILASPKEQLKAILEFCELEEPPQEISKYWDLIKSVGIVHHQNIYGNFAQIESICHEEMKRFGYL